LGLVSKRALKEPGMLWGFAYDFTRWGGGVFAVSATLVMAGKWKQRSGFWTPRFLSPLGFSATNRKIWMVWKFI